MHIWTIEKWKRLLPPERITPYNKVYLFCDSSIDPEVKTACWDFVDWLKGEYTFPLPMRIYVRVAKRIKALDGDLVCGTFFEPDDYRQNPCIRIATGDYDELRVRDGRDDALAALLLTLAHEMTHYFQWINDLKLTEMGRERQAAQYACYILDEYAETREHP